MPSWLIFLASLFTASILRVLPKTLLTPAALTLEDSLDSCEESTQDCGSLGLVVRESTYLLQRRATSVRRTVEEFSLANRAIGISGVRALRKLGAFAANRSLGAVSTHPTHAEVLLAPGHAKAARSDGLQRKSFALAQLPHESCTLQQKVFPVVIFAGFVLVGLFFLCKHVRDSAVEQASRSIYLCINFTLGMNYSIVILDSYDFCATLGMSQGDSGRMVGTYMAGFCAGVVLMWLLVRRRPDLWRHSPRPVLFGGLCFQFVGTVGYVIVASKATYSMKGVDFTNIVVSMYKLLFGVRTSPNLAHALIMSRFISGVGSGYCQQFYVGSNLHLTPVNQRPTHTGRWVFSGMLAIGSGPLISGALQELNVCSRTIPDFTVTGMAQLVGIVAAIVALCLHPSLETVPDSLEEITASPWATLVSTAEGFQSRRKLVLGCLLGAFFSSFGISAIEVVMASLLEGTYGWDRRLTGVTIGATFLCCVPMRIFHQAAAHLAPTTAWIRVLSSLSLFACFLFFRGTCDVLGTRLRFDCADLLVLAGMVIFPTLNMGEALACGLMHQHVLPPGSRLDANQSVLWYSLCRGCGRFAGPWLARLAVQGRGQDLFAEQQVCVVILFLVVFEVLVRPNVTFPEAGQDKDLSDMLTSRL